MGVNDMTGRIVLVESMKFSDAQKRPESAFVSVNQRPSALQLTVSSHHLKGLQILEE